jgi:hypothetical protein
MPAGALQTLIGEEVERRLPLWRALANFYLDTEGVTFVAEVVDAATEGKFSSSEVENILRWEVRPALYPNLLSVAGEWAGWDDDWLRDHMATSLERRIWLRAWPVRWFCRNWFMPPEWTVTQAAISSSAPTVSSIHAPPSTRLPS